MNDFPKVFSYNYLGVYINKTKKKIMKNKIQKRKMGKKARENLIHPQL